MEILPIRVELVDMFMSLFLDDYDEERRIVEILPPREEIQEMVSSSLERIIQHGVGFYAIDEGRLVGYLVGIPTGPLFGLSDGVVVPIHGFASVGDVKKVTKTLYLHAVQEWVRRGWFSQAVVMFAHHQVLKEVWFELGFGARCADAIRDLSTPTTPFSPLTIKKVVAWDLPELAPIHQEHHLYYRQAPMFMPNPDEDALQDLQEWFSQKDHHMWVAKRNTKFVGYMRIQPEGESILSRHPKMMNITGAYVIPEERGHHVGASLLEEITAWVHKNGYTRLGVDYEVLNPIGSSFWEKHFTPYTLSVARRIDERITPYL